MKERIFSLVVLLPLLSVVGWAECNDALCVMLRRMINTAATQDRIPQADVRALIFPGQSDRFQERGGGGLGTVGRGGTVCADDLPPTGHFSRMNWDCEHDLSSAELPAEWFYRISASLKKAMPQWHFHTTSEATRIVEWGGPAQDCHSGRAEYADDCLVMLAVYRHGSGSAEWNQQLSIDSFSHPLPRQPVAAAPMPEYHSVAPAIPIEGHCGRNDTDCAAIVGILNMRANGFRDLRIGSAKPGDKGSQFWDAKKELRSMDYCWVSEDPEGSEFVCHADAPNLSSAQDLVDRLRDSARSAAWGWSKWIDEGGFLSADVNYREGPDHSHYALEITLTKWDLAESKPHVTVTVFDHDRVTR